MTIHPKLAHLSGEQLERLLHLYEDASVPVRDIISEFSIATTPSGLNALLPPIIHADCLCPHCAGIPLQSRRPSRNSSFTGAAACPNCGHRDVDRCHCRNCREIEAKERQWFDEIKRDVIREDYGGRYWESDFDDLTLRDVVYLSALIRQSLTEDLVIVEPYAPGPPRLAPTSNYMRKITEHLQGKALLAVDPESPIDAFLFNEELTEAPRYFPDKVTWLFLPGLDKQERKNFLERLSKTIDDDWPPSWIKDMPGLWREVIKAEAFEYFLHLLNQRGYRLDQIGDKTNAVFDFLIERFPLSKIYNLMWQAVRDVTDYNVKNDIPSYRAKNNFIGAVQRKAEKYIAQGWDLKDSRRDFECPRTWISSTFFDTFMKVGENAFTALPPDQ